MFTPDEPWTFRDLEGVEPVYNEGDKPDPALPRNDTITTRLEGPYGIPWIEGFENPDAATGLKPTAYPQMDIPDVGGVMGPGAYRGEYRTLGPVRAFGLEPSGGWNGDQAIGRIMRFPANIPDRYDANGVYVGDYRDSLAAAMAVNSMPTFTDQTVIEDLVGWTGPAEFGGWGT